MTEVLDGLVVDLADEVTGLVDLLGDLDERGWSTPTPAPGWAVRDQVCHLAHFDWVTRLAITRPADFAGLRDGLERGAGLQAYVDSIGPAHASRSGADLLAWWCEQATLLRSAVATAPAGERVPWFGPSMSLASKVTARIMETWAHGQDVADALGVARAPSQRLRHVARIGFLALPNSFAAHGLATPQEPIRVSITSPTGDTWSWGEPTARDVVSGTAVDFCLVVTRRRHPVDTGLEVVGPTARAWVEIAQAFAGPPGAGRRPGQVFPGFPPPPSTLPV